jgi:hypothetical protein
MRLIMVLAAAVLLGGCGEGKIEAGQVVGQWKNVYMKLDMPSYKGGDSARSIEVSEKNWEQTMNIRAIRTTYNKDGTYQSPHFNLKDSLFYNPAGHWRLSNDSIIMTDTFPAKGPEYRYALRRNGDTLLFTGIEDMDSDGERDDRYFGKQKMVAEAR